MQQIYHDKILTIHPACSTRAMSEHVMNAMLQDNRLDVALVGTIYIIRDSMYATIASEMLVSL